MLSYKSQRVGIVTRDLQNQELLQTKNPFRFKGKGFKVV